MLLGIAIVVGLGAGAFFMSARRPELLPPSPGDLPATAPSSGTAASSPGAGSAPPGAPRGGAPKELKDALRIAKEGAGIIKGDAAAAAQAVTEILNGTVGAHARSEEAKITASVGTGVAAGVAALAATLYMKAAIAGPVGIAIATAALVVTAIVVNLVEAAVALDRSRQLPFLQAEIDALVRAGRLREAWGLRQEAWKRSIFVHFAVSVPTWGDAKECVRWPPPGQGDGGGATFLDAELLIRTAYQPAHDALQLDLKLPVKRNADGTLQRPRTNRDSAAAREARKNGDAWCHYIGGHYESGVADDGRTIVNEWCGLTPWQASDVLWRAYAPHDPPDDTQREEKKQATINGNLTAAGIRYAELRAVQGTAASSPPASGSSGGTTGGGNTSTASTGGGRAGKGDASAN